MSTPTTLRGESVWGNKINPEKENEKMDFCNFFAGVLRL